MQTLTAGIAGHIETRRAFDGSVVINGRFPYGGIATFGVGRSETFEQGAFTESINSGDNIFMLFSHDNSKPLASRSNGTMTISEDSGALAFESTISAAMLEVTFIRDAVATIEAGLTIGLSPGFRVEAAKDQSVVRANGGIQRRIKKARLLEISAVTRAAYPQAQLEARNWGGAIHNTHALNRWRV